MVLELATQSDLNFILEWLKAEDATFVQPSFDDSSLAAQRQNKGFWCNRGVIQECFKNNELYVFKENGSAIAFHLGELISPGITEVHPDHRGKGIGTKIVTELIDLARSRNVCGLEIEMKPSSSRLFWEGFGFTSGTPCSDDARLSLEYDLPLTEAENCLVTIDFFTNGEWHDDNRQSFKSYSIPAFKLGNFVKLSKRAHPFDTCGSDGCDTFSTVYVNGEAVFDEKLKYPQATCFGFQKASCYTLFLDSFELQNSHIRSYSPFCKALVDAHKK